jgi:hypothetical protein
MCVCMLVSVFDCVRVCVCVCVCACLRLDGAEEEITDIGDECVTPAAHSKAKVSLCSTCLLFAHNLRLLTCLLYLFMKLIT